MHGSCLFKEQMDTSGDHLCDFQLQKTLSLQIRGQIEILRDWDMFNIYTVISLFYICSLQLQALYVILAFSVSTCFLSCSQVLSLFNFCSCIITLFILPCYLSYLLIRFLSLSFYYLYFPTISQSLL